MGIEIPVMSRKAQDRETMTDADALIIVGAVEEGSGGSPFGQLSWPTHRVHGRREFEREMARVIPRVVVCEQHLPDGTWKDILDLAAGLRHPAPVVVTSRVADEQLWAEVLNLGGYDLLAKPLDARELLRAMNLAWQHWKNQQSARERAQASKNRPEV